MASPVGLHRVLAPRGVLPQAAERLDTSPEIAPDEVRVRVERLNLDPELALAVLDVCGAPALTNRVVHGYPQPARVAVIGGAGKSGSLSLAAARRAGARTVGVVPNAAERDRLAAAGLADEVVLADARDPVALAEAVGAPADVTVVCV